jgi:serine protease DegQ
MRVFLLILFALFHCGQEQNILTPQIIYSKSLSATLSIAPKKNSLDESFEWIGSGFVFHEDGYALTCNHVVLMNDDFVVRIGEKGKKYFSYVIKREPDLDIAIIKIRSDNESFPSLTIDERIQVKPGEEVYSIGSPFGLEESFDSYYVSYPSRRINDSQKILSAKIQLHKPVLPGASGSPILNKESKVIGMGSMQIQSILMKNQGIGFAIPAAELNKIIKTLDDPGLSKVGIQKGIVEIPFITPHLIQKLNLPRSNGCLVSFVEKDSPAEKSGIQRYDLIYRINEEEISDCEKMYEFLYSKNKMKSDFEFHIVRESKIKTIRLN